MSIVAMYCARWLPCLAGGYICAVKVPVFQTRLAYIWNVLQPQQLLVIAGFLWLGGLAGYCLSKLVGYDGLTVTCSQHK